MAAGLVVSLIGMLDFRAVEFTLPSSSSSSGRRGYVVECDDGDIIEEHLPGLRLLRFQSPLVISRASAVGALITQQSLVGAAVPLVLLDQLCGEALTDASLHVFFAVCACVLPGVRCSPFDANTSSSSSAPAPTYQTSTAQLWSLLVLAELWQAPRLVDALSAQVRLWPAWKHRLSQETLQTLTSRHTNPPLWTRTRRSCTPCCAPGYTVARGARTGAAAGPIAAAEATAAAVEEAVVGHWQCANACLPPLPAPSPPTCAAR